MYIFPSSTLHILKDVPLDSSYRNTIFFQSESAQRSFFASKTKYTLQNQSYMRLNDRRIRVDLLSDNLYDCNYIMFQNSAFGNKWFYGFITSVEYVNNTTSRITFDIDVMQTWFFDYEIPPCFVEREMSVQDVIGENLVPENLELGDYVYKAETEDMINWGDYKIVVAAAFDQNYEDSEGGLYGGYYSALTYHTFDDTDWEQAQTFINQAVEENKGNGIVSVFMVPSVLITARMNASPPSYFVGFPKRYTALDGYIPKNKKLFTYPYNFLFITNNEGGAANYPYEYFNNPNQRCVFVMRGTSCATPEANFIPTNYKGVAENVNERLTLGNFPQCAWTQDTYRAWVAQNQSRILLDEAMGVVKVVGGAAIAAAGVAGAPVTAGTSTIATGVGLSMVASGIQSVLSINAAQQDKSTLPPQAKGGGSVIDVAQKLKGFYGYNVTIRAEFAKIIDDFFSMYGYATHRVKVPNRTSRPHWNYVKTVNIGLKGSIPADDLAKLERIYDNGITFWKNGNEVGNYNLNNGV